MSRTLAHFTLPVERIRDTVQRVQTQENCALDVVLRGIGDSICAASGSTHSVMRLIGALAADGEAALLTAETA